MNVFLKLVVTLSFALVSSEAQQRRSNITQGSSLTPTHTSSWPSSSGLYAFGFYQQGNGFAVGIFLAGVPEKTVTWTFNRDDPPVPANATLQFTSEGQLVLESTQGQKFIGDQAQQASTASMLDSGNFVFYTSDGRAIWQSFDHPTDTLLPGQRLLEGNQLVSSASESVHSSGFFTLIMQGDGNLVQYPMDAPTTRDTAYYESDTYGAGPNVSLVFDTTGRLFLRNSSGVNIHNVTNIADSDRESTARLMRIDVDGIFRLYSLKNESWSIEWSSTVNKCDPTGLCGLNGFCVLNDLIADCRCLPGFHFVQRGKFFSGCWRSFVANSCGNKTGVALEEVPNTAWERNDYSVVSVDNKDGCVKACLEDCNCEVAFYVDRDRECRKQRLPLRFGRRSGTDLIVTLVKVYDPIPLSGGDRDSSGPEAREREIRKDVLIISIALVSVGFAMMVVSVAVVLYRNKIRSYRKIDGRSGDTELLGEELVLKSFTFKEMERMTGGFKEEIGKGSFGTVYKGKIPNREREVAVKRLDRVSEDGEQEFRNEMKSIGRTYHKNLVRLLGYCHDGPNRLLVYEYMSNGSLADTIFRPENQPCWEERLGIACGIARGIFYLHEECETLIIHCDIKPQNILMDEQRRAKISDFGLAKLLKPNQTTTFTGIRGTRGYVAPEWHRKQPITAKADVYSFGIVLLEIICCRRSVNWELPEEEAVLEEWAYACFEKGQLERFVESEVVDKRQLERTIKVALWCIQDDPALRPSMKKVLLMLEGTVDIPIPPSPEFFS